MSDEGSSAPQPAGEQVEKKEEVSTTESAAAPDKPVSDEASAPANDADEKGTCAVRTRSPDLRARASVRPTLAACGWVKMTCGLASRARSALYPFAHNSISSLRDVILRALKAHPAIAAGKATLFIAVESLYSMDGDFAPLPEIVNVVDELVPPECGHIVVDEAHSD